MIDVSKAHWESLESRSPKIFLLAGVFLLVAAASNRAAFFLEGDSLEAVSGIALSLGLLTASVGAGGLYPRLEGRTPRLAQLGLTALAIGTVGWAAFSAWTVIDSIALAALPPVMVVGSFVLFVVGLLLFTAGCASFGVAIVRSTAYPRLVGLLLLAEALAVVVLNAVPFLIVALNAVPVLIELDPTGSGFALVVGIQAAILLGIGYRLRDEHVPSRHAGPVSDTAPGDQPRR